MAEIHGKRSPHECTPGPRSSRPRLILAREFSVELSPDGHHLMLNTTGMLNRVRTAWPFR